MEKQAKRDAEKAKRKAEAAKKSKSLGGDDFMGLNDMKEDPDDIQEERKMPGENPDKIKLYPILKEAYQLLEKIENIEFDANKQIAKLEKEKKRLKEKQNHLNTMTTIED